MDFVITVWLILKEIFWPVVIPALKISIPVAFILAIVIEWKNYKNKKELEKEAKEQMYRDNITSA